jgi:hypothetical protein
MMAEEQAHGWSSIHARSAIPSVFWMLSWACLDEMMASNIRHHLRTLERSALHVIVVTSTEPTRKNFDIKLSFDIVQLLIVSSATRSQPIAMSQPTASS